MTPALAPSPPESAGAPFVSGGRARALVAAWLLGWVAAVALPDDVAVGTFVDDAQYAVLAKALREHAGYRVLNLPGAPVETKYPPGYPALLALVWDPAQPDAVNLQRLRWVNLGLLGPLAAVLALAGMELFRLSPTLSASLALGGVLAPLFVRLWSVPLSEPLFVLVVTVGLVLVARRRGATGLALLALAVYVRSLAAPFLVGALLATWRAAGWRTVARSAALPAALVVPWAVWLAVHGRATPEVLSGIYGSYGQWYAGALRDDWVAVLLLAPLKNILLAATVLGEALAGWTWLPGIALGTLGAWAAWRLWAGRRVQPVATMGLALYFAASLLWPFPQAGRFVGAVWPLVLLALAQTFRRGAWVLAAASLATGVIGFARSEGIAPHRRAGASSDLLLERIRPLIPTGALVAASNPPLYYLRLGVPAVPNDRMRAHRWYRHGYWATAWGLGDDLWAIIREYHPQYVVIERRGAEGRYAAGSLMRQCPGVLSEVWRSPGAEFVFAVADGVPCAPASAARTRSRVPARRGTREP